MKPSSMFRVLVVVASIASLSACGGGGGGGSSSQTAPTPPANTGLSAPTLTLSQRVEAAIPLVQEMAGNASTQPVEPGSYALADEAQAMKALGSMVPGVGNASPSPFTCANPPGNISFTSAGGNFDYSYNNCSDGIYTFNGTSQVTPTIVGGVVTSYRIAFTNLLLTGPNGLSANVTGSLTCTPAATAGQAPSCTTTVGGYVWGYDISYGGTGSANGSHQCGCDQTWNVTFKNFTATGGVAEVFATNGSAIVTRTGAKTFTVVMFVGSTVGTYDVTLS